MQPCARSPFVGGESSGASKFAHMREMSLWRCAGSLSVYRVFHALFETLASYSDAVCPAVRAWSAPAYLACGS